MIQIITTTLKSDKTVKSTGTVLPAGTVVITGIKRLAGTAAERAERTAMLEGVLDACTGKLSRLKKDDVARVAAKEAVRIARENLKRHDAGISYKGAEFMAILGGVHPTVSLDRHEKGFLLQSLKGLVIEAELA
jgi:hypothetical protein